MRYQALMTALALSLGIWACQQRAAADYDTSMVSFDTGTASRGNDNRSRQDHNDTAAKEPSSPDGDVLGSFIAINQDGVEDGRLATQQGSTQAVRDLGKTFARDHDDLIQRARQLGTKLSVTPAANASDPTAQIHAAAVADLRGKSGKEFDRAFLQHEIDFHQAAINALNNTMLPNATNAEIKTFLQQAIPTYQAHQQGAQDLRAKLPAE